MTRYAVDVFMVQTYYNSVIVEADSKEDARIYIENLWNTASRNPKSVLLRKKIFLDVPEENSWLSLDGPEIIRELAEGEMPDGYKEV